jgi:hypothetical protein
VSARGVEDVLPGAAAHRLARAVGEFEDDLELGCCLQGYGL